MPDQHALLSASGAHRWLNCPPSAVLEADKPDTSGEAAAQGTAAHALAEHKLRRALKLRSRRPTSKFQDDEMEDLTDNYVAYVRSVLEDLTDPLVMVEERLDYSAWVPDGFGTGDCVIVSDGALHVIDLKYGQGVLVDCEWNPQMMLYGLGAYHALAMLYDDITEITLHIFQPRRDNVSSWTVSVKDLLEWAANTVRPTAKLAAEGAGEFTAGEWCGFCKLKATCRARAEANLELAGLEFRPSAELSETEIAEVLRVAPDLVKWAGDVQKYALEQALGGTSYEGFKLVEGRAVRVYTDPEKVAEATKTAGYEDVYDQKLIGITAMEKLMGKKQFGEILGDLVIKPAGKPTLVPATDRRKAIDVATPEDDFKKEEK